MCGCDGVHKTVCGVNGRLRLGFVLQRLQVLLDSVRAAVQAVLCLKHLAEGAATDDSELQEVVQIPRHD